MNLVLPKKYLTKQSLVSWIYVVMGGIVMSAGFVLFMNPYRVVPGGVYGMGIVLHELFPAIQVGTFGLMLDIPLLLIGFRVFGRMFGSKTIVAALLIPLVMNTMTFLIGNDPALMFGGKFDLRQDMILVCLFGGVVIGTGLGLILRGHATSGGTDIIAMLLARYTKLTFSRGILITDSIVVIFGLVVLGDWRMPLYSLVTIFVVTRMIDYVIDGGSYDKLLFIISEKHEEIRTFVLDNMGRGGTYVKSSGMYTRKDKDMIFLVVSRVEVSLVEKTIREIDPAAFVVIVNAYETYGEGFKSFPANTN